MTVKQWWILALAALIAVGCEQEPSESVGAGNRGSQSSNAQGSPLAVANPQGLEPFMADFPVPLLRLTRVSGRHYDRSRTKALESLIAKLEGGHSAKSWKFATNFFWRAGEEAVAPLVEAMDRAMTQPSKRSHLENILKAMTQLGHEGLGEAVMRAVTHGDPALREAAIQAISRCGSPAHIRQLGETFVAMSPRGKSMWLRAVRLQLGDDAIPYFADLLQQDMPPVLMDTIMKEVVEMPVDRALAILDPLWARSRGALRLTIAGLKHRKGDGVGTRTLQEALASGDVRIMVEALDHLSQGALDLVVDAIYPLAEHPVPDVRLAVTEALARVADGNATRSLELLATDAAREVRIAALIALGDRGETAATDQLVRELHTATGTRLNELLEMIYSARIGAAAPVLATRFERSPPGEGRDFLRTLGLIRRPAAFPPLRAVFLAPEKTFLGRSGGTTMSVAATMFQNLRGAEDDLVALFGELDGQDLRRRALLIETLGQVAADRSSRAVKETIYGVLREVLFDTEEVQQIRALTLVYLQREMTLDDGMKMKRAIAAEQPGIQRLFSDFLFEFF